MSTSFLHSTIAALACVVLAVPATAQSQVDIGLYQLDNKLEVRIVPHADFDGVFSNIFFAIRWERSTDAALGAVNQKGAPAQYIPMARIGPVHESGMYRYQLITGFGMMPMSDIGEGWKAGKEYTIATIAVTGNAEFSLISDEWTSKADVNADYYAALGGLDMTGTIYKGNQSTTGRPQLAIYPNPNRGQFVLNIPTGPNEDLWYEITNGAGQVVRTERLNATAQAYIKDMDLTKEGSGIYDLRIHRDGVEEVKRIIIAK